jgi:dihydrofolate synthase/folylpolyglutamate synthase
MAARNLGRYIEENLMDRAITLVIGILDDKPYGAILKSLIPHCRRVILTQARSGRALPAEKLVETVSSWTEDVRVIPNVAQAIEKALTHLPDNGAVIVAGSLYVVGEAKEYFDGTGPVELVKP